MGVGGGCDGGKYKRKYVWFFFGAVLFFISFFL